jgi:hypothetical protein
MIYVVRGRERKNKSGARVVNVVCMNWRCKRGTISPKREKERAGERRILAEARVREPIHFLM